MIYLLTILILVLWLILLGKLKPNKKNLEIEVVKSFLPQTSCQDCGYDSCEPYAKSMLEGEKINLCTMGTHRSFNLLRDYFAYSSKIGSQNYTQKVEIIDAKCIGCTRCIKICPVDAIVGAAKQMHSVIAEICNGCRLCLQVCPTDCIELVEKKPPTKPTAFLNCINCGKCNSLQNPNMSKLYYLVEAYDCDSLAKLNLSLNENRETLNASCPVGIPLFDYLNYGIYLSKEALVQAKFAQTNLQLQQQKIARNLAAQAATKASPKASIIPTFDLDKNQTQPQVVNNLFLDASQPSDYVNPELIKTSSMAKTSQNPEPILTQKTVAAKSAMALSEDMQTKLAALKTKMQTSKPQTSISDFDITKNQKANYNIAKKVAQDNLNNAKKVLHNLKKATDSNAQRIREQKQLIAEAQKQLENIDKEFMLE